jgi:uncharacterized repeat protein (TIGR01451 family)
MIGPLVPEPTPIPEAPARGGPVVLPTSGNADRKAPATVDTGMVPQPMPAPVAERAAEGTAGNDNPTGRQEPSVSLEWSGPAAARVGVAADYSLVVHNTCAIPVHQVLVRVKVPAGMSVAGTEPRALGESNVLVWELGTLPARQRKVLTLRLLAETRGDLMPQAWVTFTGSSVLHVKVREPKLALQVGAPEKLPLGDTGVFTLAVSNPGDGAAEQVRIHAVLSEGLENPRGGKIDFEIGNLAAGESRTVTVLCGTRAGGPQRCDATAEAEGSLSTRGSATVAVVAPRLDLQVIGPALRYLGRKAVYTLKVANPGDAPAANVSVTDSVPDGFKVLAATHGGRHDPAAHTVSWFLGEIPPGQAREVQLEVQAASPGDHHHRAVAVGVHGLRAEAELATQVEGLSALLVEMVDTEDPIEVNSETAYEVRISNTGSKVETDIKLAATVPEQMEFVAAQGPVRYRAEGKQIAFEPLEQLAPQASTTFRIRVKAREAGTVRFKIQLTSTNLVEPVIKMEATRIYADTPDARSSAGK